MAGRREDKALGRAHTARQSGRKSTASDRCGHESARPWFSRVWGGSRWIALGSLAAEREVRVRRVTDEEAAEQSTERLIRSGTPEFTSRAPRGHIDRARPADIEPAWRRADLP